MSCWANYLFCALVAALAVGQMVTACGQKGDLYLPPEQAKPRPAAERPQVPNPAPDVDEEGLEATEDVPSAAPPKVSPPAEGL